MVAGVLEAADHAGKWEAVADVERYDESGAAIVVEVVGRCEKVQERWYLGRTNKGVQEPLCHKQSAVVYPSDEPRLNHPL